MQAKQEMEAIKALNEKVADSGWQNLQFMNSYHSNDEQNPAQYRKIGNIVYLRGLVYNGGNANRNTAQLPTGFFNSSWINNCFFPVWFNGETGNCVQITNLGAIISPRSMTNEQWYSLDGISFLVD